MNAQERIRYMTVYPMTARTRACANCKHFIQHFLHDGYGFRPVYMGHCVHLRLKNRRPGDACDRFASRWPETGEAARE